MSQPDEPPEPAESLTRVQYYAIAGRSRTRDNPSGLARRRVTPQGTLDESLRRDLTWGRTSAIIEREWGEIGLDLYEISEAEAEALIERFRARRPAADQ
jgi:hypothetical protein